MHLQQNVLYKRDLLLLYIKTAKFSVSIIKYNKSMYANSKTTKKFLQNI